MQGRFMTYACIVYLAGRRRGMTTRELADELYYDRFLNSEHSPATCRSLVYTALWRGEKRGEVVRVVEENSNERAGWREAVWRIAK